MPPDILFFSPLSSCPLHGLPLFILSATANPTIHLTSPYTPRNEIPPGSFGMIKGRLSNSFFPVPSAGCTFSSYLESFFPHGFFACWGPSLQRQRVPPLFPCQGRTVTVLRGFPSLLSRSIEFPRPSTCSSSLAGGPPLPSTSNVLSPFRSECGFNRSFVMRSAVLRLPSLPEVLI